MHYTIAGKGEPLLFIHGFGMSSRVWSQQVEYFQQGFQVIAVDLPGHGKSPWEKDQTLRDLAGEVRRVMVAVGVQQVNVTASSFGGLVAFELARMAPDLIARISFCVALPKFARSEGYPAGLDIDRIRTLSAQFQVDYAQILEIFFRSLFTRQERMDAHFAWVRQMRQGEPLPRREALLCYLDILERVDLRDRLASMICPVQFINGTEDYICPQAVLGWLQEHFLNARFDYIDQCGHVPFLTKPQEFNETLEFFLMN